jgi:two-component system chemotaxis response regulator CheB
MDINMPKMDGLMAIGHIMRAAPRPIVVISSYTRKCAEAAIQALDLGAIDVVEKTSDSGVSLDMDRSSEEIIKKVRQASRIRVVRTGGRSATRIPSDLSHPSHKTHEEILESSIIPSSSPSLIAIGSSTGGPAALRDLFRSIPSANFPPIAIVQHLPANFTRELADQLADVSCINVVEAVAGQKLQPGYAYIAPGNQHMELDAHLRIVLNSDAPVKHCRPAVDVLLHSVAKQCGDSALGIVLTGMGDDGSAGALAMKKAGAQVVAQDEASCLVYGMPRAVVEAGAATDVLSLDKIKRLLGDVARRRATKTILKETPFTIAATPAAVALHL